MAEPTSASAKREVLTAETECVGGFPRMFSGCPDSSIPLRFMKRILLTLLLVLPAITGFAHSEPDTTSRRKWRRAGGDATECGLELCQSDSPHKNANYP